MTGGKTTVLTRHLEVCEQYRYNTYYKSKVIPTLYNLKIFINLKLRKKKSYFSISFKQTMYILTEPNQVHDT
jgi:hypothetical protein